VTEYKIVFTGTVGAGKTSAIAAVSETPPVVTDVPNTDATVDKALTTVGLDFGMVTLEGGQRLRLFGTPGQARFDFLWGILARNALGLVVLVDNTRPAPLEDLAQYLKGFGDALAQVPCVIGVGRLAPDASPSLDDYAEFLGARGLALPVLAVDVRRRADVLLLIDMLLTQLEADMAQPDGR
jgi:signal recognition particle receptor subunit beta